MKRALLTTLIAAVLTSFAARADETTPSTMAVACGYTTVAQPSVEWKPAPTPDSLIAVVQWAVPVLAGLIGLAAIPVLGMSVSRASFYYFNAHPIK